MEGAVQGSVSDHSKVFHVNALADLCRLCGQQAQTAKEKKKNVLHQVLKVPDLTLEVFGINVSQDMADVHPTCCAPSVTNDVECEV